MLGNGEMCQRKFALLAGEAGQISSERESIFRKNLRVNCEKIIKEN